MGTPVPNYSDPLLYAYVMIHGFTDSVNEANEVLGGMLNTHKCFLESGVKIQKKMESHPTMIKLGDLLETAFGISRRYPKKSGEGRKKICALSHSGKNSQEGKGSLLALVRPGGHEPTPE